MGRKIDRLLWQIYIQLFSFAFIPNWLIPKGTKTVLDVASGQGLPMNLINLRHKGLYSVGVELFKPYVKKCKEQKIHSKYIIQDVRKINFKDDSFDVVLALQILEHLKKKEAWELLQKIEKIAKKRVIIATPYGDCPYHTHDGNDLQEHHCIFYPEDFTKRGYKVVRMGGKSLFDEGGLAFRITNPFLRKMIFVLDIFLTPYYLLFPERADYFFFAYKNTNK